MPSRCAKEPSRRSQIVVALVALAASVPGLLNDFVYDDLPIIRDNPRVQDLGHWWDILTKPYWPPPFVEQLYRPVAVELLAAEHVLGGGNPVAFRLVSYALYVACSIAVLRLAWRVLPPTAALVAAVLFAAQPIHVEAVALGVNQGELVVGLIALAMTIRYLDARLAGVQSRREWVILVALYALAALTKESGFILPGLLLVTELTLVSRESLRSRVSELLGGYASFAAVALCLLGLRASVLQQAVSVIPVVDLRGLSLAGRATAMLQMVPTWLGLLAFPAMLKVDYHLVSIEWVAILLEGIGVAVIMAALYLMYRTRRSAPAISFGIAWCGVALIPVSNLIPTGVLVAERTLFLPSVGFVIAIGGAAAALLHRRDHRVLRFKLVAACAVLAALGIAKSAVRELSWNSAHVRVIARRPSKR